MYKDKNQKLQTNFRMIYETEEGKFKKGKKLLIEDLLGNTFQGIAYCNFSALFLNSANRSIRIVAEDVGVLKIFEKKSVFDDYSDVKEEF